MPYAVHSLASPAVLIDHAGTYAVAPDGPRYASPPMDAGEGPAIFETFDEAEAWRMQQAATP